MRDSIIIIICILFVFVVLTFCSLGFSLCIIASCKIKRNYNYLKNFSYTYQLLTFCLNSCPSVSILVPTRDLAQRGFACPQYAFGPNFNASLLKTSCVLIFPGIISGFLIYHQRSPIVTLLCHTEVMLAYRPFCYK